MCRALFSDFQSIIYKVTRWEAFLKLHSAPLLPEIDFRVSQHLKNLFE